MSSLCTPSGARTNATSRLPAFPDRKGLFLDVGANSGQSALSFQVFRSESPILSFEPNALLERDLKLVGRVLKGFEYRILGAGETPRRATLYVSVYRGLPLTGEASLDLQRAQDHYWVRQLGRHADLSALSVESVPIEIVRLDDLDLAPSFVKIDVEGGELAVVRGVRRTIDRHRPVLLVEATKGHSDVVAFLSRRGYGGYLYEPASHRLVPYQGQPAQNVFHVPVEEMTAAAHCAPAVSALPVSGSRRRPSRGAPSSAR
jgi:FkbM family methyltransferase